MAAPEPRNAAQEYWVIRALGGAGIVSRELQAAQQALQELGLEAIEEPTPHNDARLLEECRSRDHRGAFLCLRCRVSWPLEQRARSLHRRFAREYGLELSEVAAFALDDDGRLLPYAPPQPGTAVLQREPFSAEVIRSFDPARGLLSHWARLKFDGRNDLKAYLKQQGMLLIREWALLAAASQREVRLAVERHSGTLLPEAAATLQARYVTLYRAAKLRHRRQTHSQLGWTPDVAFLRQLEPDQEARETALVLREISTAVRAHRSGRWQRQAQALDEETLDHWVARHGVPAEAGAEDGLAEGLPIQEMVAIVEQEGLETMQQAVAGCGADTLARCLWQGYGEGRGQRAIAERCGTNQARVTRTLQEEKRAEQIVTAVLQRLRTLWGGSGTGLAAAVFGSPQGLRMAEERLMNHLLKPEQPGGVSAMRRWAAQALHQPSESGAKGSGDGS
ncbi:MAG: hypothetical protein VKI83_02680 [Synechococcaceae cyanobacterium]|nr:hypothetical protein [Synechococcaceae cyanobacterium]